jgi:hypothetical protein
MTTAIIAVNNNLSKVDFIGRVTRYLQPVTRRYNKMAGRERVKSVLLDIERYARYNEEDGISVMYSFTAYAVRWSLDTLRLNLEPEHALEAMNVRELVTFIHELHVNCPTQGDVTKYLNNKFVAK